MKVLVVSSANMDMVLNVSSVPEAGQTVVEDGKYSYVPGGKGANSAMAFKRLGADCTLVARIGNDQNGEELLQLYKRDGLNTDYIVRDKDAPTGLATIFVEGSGQNRIIVFAGANQKIDKAQIDGALEQMPDALYLQFEINYDAIIYSATEAHKRGIPVFIDAGAIKPSFPFEKLPPLEMFSPNETETLTICGIMPSDEDKCLEASRAISRLVNAKYIVIKLGGRGAYIFDGEKGAIIPTFDAKVVDTTAAGDAFTAAMTLDYLKQGNIYDACKYGHAAGTITVSRKGASSSIPTKDEVESFLLGKA